MAVPLLAAALTRPAVGLVWPNTIERIERQLAQGTTAERRQAAARLRELPRATAGRLALEALNDQDLQVRLEAAEIARELRLPGAGARVVGWLHESERRVRLAAVELLRVSPTRDAVAALARVLGDPDSAVRAAAADALGASGDRAASLPLLGHLDDPTPHVRDRVVLALARLEDRRAVVPLIGKIQDPQPQVRRSVARALGELGDPRATSALLLALRDADASVRTAALGAIEALGDPSATLAIVAVLEQDADEAVRSAALRALSGLRSDTDLDALMAGLSEDDPSAERSEVRDALARFGPGARGALERCLRGQPAARLGDGCALTLARVAGDPSVPVLVQALRRGIVSPTAAMRAFGSAGSPKGLPTVLEYVAHRDPFVRRAAIDAASQLLSNGPPDGRAVDPLSRALAVASDDAERIALIGLLGQTGASRAARPLKPLAENADAVAIRVAAVEALGMLGPVGQDDVLLRALDADSASLRIAAGLALKRSASGRSAGELLDRLERRAEQDRAAVSLALGGALARTQDAGHLQRAARLLERSRAGERDALIEAAGQSRAPGALGLLVKLAASPAPADRAKAAELLALHAEGAEALRRLASDPSPAVRANAVWALGAGAAVPPVELLVQALGDRDVNVAANAAAGLGRLESDERAKRALCAATEDPRDYVRANAMAALALGALRCEPDRARDLLANDRSEVVRVAAARSLHRRRATAKEGAAEDGRALQQCSARDSSGAVASACSEPPSPAAGAVSVSVYVIPTGRSVPAGGAPFTLLLPDGLMRLGVTDRRGAVFEPAAPIGQIRLLVPAALAR